MNSRNFKVLDSSGLAFYSAPPPLCTNFDGMTLPFIRDIPELGQVLLKQPAPRVGTVALDYAHVKEVEVPDELC